MQIKVNLKIIFFIILFIITKQIKLYGILMLFALLHEIGHLIIGVVLGFRPKALTVKPVGLAITFKTRIEDFDEKVMNGNKLEIKKIFIALAGPISNLIIAVLYYKYDIEILGIPRDVAIYSNLLIGIFNLLPIYPLDGGRILKSLLHIIKGFKKAVQYANIISYCTVIFITIIASLAILYFKNIAILIMVCYLWGIIGFNKAKFNSILSTE